MPELLVGVLIGSFCVVFGWWARARIYPKGQVWCTFDRDSRVTSICDSERVALKIKDEDETVGAWGVIG